MSKHFVFTSAGDNSSFIKWWCSAAQTYDIYVVYYGDNGYIYEEYAKHVAYIERAKGSKFQNFYNFYKKHPDIIAKYERFFILDDDIEITSRDINRMFEISQTYDLMICGPSFKGDSKIAHPITRNKNNTLLEYTNFVEVNTPLFNKIALFGLMRYFDQSLIGYGIDYLYIWANGLYKKDKYAIIHEISCRNPHDAEKKDGKRELNLILNVNNKEILWRTYASKVNCPVKFAHVVYRTVSLPLV